jgi:hypothetical protein
MYLMAAILTIPLVLYILSWPPVVTYLGKCLDMEYNSTAFRQLCNSTNDDATQMFCIITSRCYFLA